MGNYGILNELIEAKLMDLHTAYVGRVLSIEGSYASVEPLNMIKEQGKKARRPAPVRAHIASHAAGRVTAEEIAYVESGSDNAPQIKKTVAVIKPLAKGDIVVCICADRDITGAVQGQDGLPVSRRHSLSDSIVVGVV